MRRISDEINLTGKIETITMMDFRKSPGEVIDSAMMGKVFIITKAGKPRAVLSRVPGQQLAIVVDGKGRTSYTLET